jgi:hypothetical protein
MTEADVASLAAAIAKANGHTEVDDWVAKVVAAWTQPGDVAEARAEEMLKREEE